MPLTVSSKFNIVVVYDHYEQYVVFIEHAKSAP